MSITQTHARRLSVVAAAACGVLALSACSGGNSSSGSSSASSASTTSATSTASLSSTSSASSSATGSASSSSTSSKSSATSTSATKSTKPTPKTDPVAACSTANSKSNAAIGQWNTAVSSQSKTKLDAAAHNLQNTATQLRKLPTLAGQKGFTNRVTAVAKDLETMAANRFAGKTVDPAKYNTDSESLRSYCQKVLTTE